VETPDGYITPPPGLIPPAPADDAKPKRGETTEKFPSFLERPRGVMPPEVAETSTALRADGAVRWTLVLPDGAVLSIDGVTVVGRNPSPIPSAPDADAVALDDPERSLSKTHALLAPSEGVLAITDLHSTNGVAVVDASGATTVAEPGVALAATDGAVLVLGRYRVTLRAAR
jgi:hypothetical protein